MFIYVSSSDFVGGEEGGVPQDMVSVVAVDAEGAMRLVQSIQGVCSPTYMARNPVQPVLYVLERFIKADKSTPTPAQMAKDGLRAYAISPSDGTLSDIGRTPTGGESPMHLSLHPSGRFVFTANPGRPKDPDPVRGHVTAIDTGSDGATFRLAGSANYEGVAPVWRHRPKTYPHSVFPDPAGRRVFVPQLMTDRVTIYNFDAQSGALTAAFQPYVQVSSGAGPRHVAFRPDGRFFYVVNSFDATLSAVEYDADSGLCTVVQTLSVHPAGFAGKKNISHALVSADGRFLYCSHRTHNSLGILSIDPESGELALLERAQTQGARPRDFAFSANGRLLVVTNQKANQLESFHVDPDTGGLRATGHVLDIYSPNCVVFGDR